VPRRDGALQFLIFIGGPGGLLERRFADQFHIL
jgi:hypothetical protein